MQKLIGVIIVAICGLSPAGANDFDQRRQLAISAIQASRSLGRDAFYTEMEKQGRALIESFPDQSDGFQFLLNAAQAAGSTKQRALLNELDTPRLPARLRVVVEALKRRANLLGAPFELKFTAVDGTQVDVSSLRGKVVLIDFWATWCGPCVAEVPRLKSAYDSLHDKGFEIVGISFDQDSTRLGGFLRTQDIRWPQYFGKRPPKRLYSESP